MSNPTYEARQRRQRLGRQYRKAAARLHSTQVDSTAHVKQMHDGAFVDITVWVPQSEAFKEKDDDSPRPNY